MGASIVGLWGLLNNVGIAGTPGPIQWMVMNDYDKAASVNLFVLIEMTMTFLPLIKREKE